jgi:hypothetical protein
MLVVPDLGRLASPRDFFCLLIRSNGGNGLLKLLILSAHFAARTGQS